MFISILPGADERPACTDNAPVHLKITRTRAGHMAAFSGIELGAPEVKKSVGHVCARSDHMSHKMEERRSTHVHVFSLLLQDKDGCWLMNLS